MQAAALSPDPGLQPAGLAAGWSEGNLEGLLWKREQRDREGHQTGEAGSVPVGRGPHSSGVWQGTERQLQAGGGAGVLLTARAWWL